MNFNVRFSGSEKNVRYFDWDHIESVLLLGACAFGLYRVFQSMNMEDFHVFWSSVAYLIVF